MAKRKKAQGGIEPVLWIEEVRKLKPSEKHLCQRAIKPVQDASYEVTIGIDRRFEPVQLFLCWRQLENLKREIKEQKAMRKVG